MRAANTCARLDMDVDMTALASGFPGGIALSYCENMANVTLQADACRPKDSEQSNLLALCNADCFCSPSSPKR